VHAVLAGTAAAVAAALTSLTQCVLGFLLIDAASQHRSARSGSLLDLINRLDGLKMVLLAVAAGALVVAGGSSGILARQHAQRLVREATFTLVAAGRPEIKDRLLKVLGQVHE